MQNKSNKSNKFVTLNIAVTATSSPGPIQRQQESAAFGVAPYVAAPHADTGHSVEFERAVADGSVVGRVLDEQRGQHEVIFSFFSVFLCLKGVDF